MTRIVFMVAFLAVVPQVAFAKDAAADAKVAQVLKDWKARYEAVKSVRYRLVGTEESMGKPIMPGATPDLPGQHPIAATILIDLPTKRYRREEQMNRLSKDKTRYVKFYTVTTFDGTTAWRGIPRENEDRPESAPDISIAKGNLSGSRIDTHLEPVFMAHGIVPTEESPLGPGRFPIRHEADEFRSLGNTVFSGKQCLVLRSGPVSASSSLSDEFWVDPQRQSAVLRQTYWSGKNPMYRTEINYKQAQQHWLPDNWTTTCSLRNEVRNVVRVRVEAVELNPSVSDEDFTLQIKPGMVVRDNQYPDRGSGLDPQYPVTKVMKADSNGGLVVDQATGYRTTDGIDLPPPSSRSWWIWGGAAVVVSMIVAWRVVARKARSRSAQSSQPTER